MRDDMARLQGFFCAFAGRMVRSGKRPRAFYSQCHERNLSTREWNVMKRRLAKYVFWEVPNNGPHCTVGSVIEVPPLSHSFWLVLLQNGYSVQESVLL